ncbi:MAG: hypothetical protein Q9179_007432 [Wetmoreana sp. 5 TL-2023]
MASPELPFCTYRFHNVPKEVDKTALKAIVPLHTDEKAVYASLAPDYEISRQDCQVGTVTWSTTPSKLKDLASEASGTLKVASDLAKSRIDIEVPMQEVAIDSHFRGLTPLSADPVGDEQAVEYHESGAMWLRDFLPRDIPAAQTFTYGYPSKLQRSGSRALLFDYTSAFLHELRRLNSRHLPTSNAIVEAAAKPEEYGRLLKCVYSIVFIGVPHRGMNTAALEEMTASEPTKDLIAELREGSTLISLLAEKFPNSIADMRILTCYELLETPTMKRTNGNWKRTGAPEMMVSKQSACLYLTNETRLPIHANHSMIAKLSDKRGSEYHSIQEHIASYVDKASTAIQRRLLKGRCGMALAEAYTLADFVYAIVCMVKKQVFEESSFKKQMGDELTFLEAFGGFLVDDELGKILDDPTLSAKYPQRICETLERLKTTFSSFASLAMRYHEPYQEVIQHGCSINPSVLKEERTTALSQKLLQDPEMSGTLLMEESLDAILQQCQKSTRRLRATMSFATLCSIRFSTQTEFERFQARREIQQTDLATIVNRQHLVRSTSQHEQQPLQGWLEHVKIRNITSDLKIKKFHREGDTHAEMVIVEYRSYNPRSIPLSRTPGHDHRTEVPARIQYLNNIKPRMRKLAGLLHDLSSKDSHDDGQSPESLALRRLNFFDCIGFLEQEDRCRFAFLFRIPRELSLESETKINSLSTYIENSNSSQIQLEQRFSLAYDFCRAVSNIHACGWVQKSIRSSNIILIPNHSSSKSMSNSNIIDNTTQLLPGEKEKKTYRPYLKGFEFSRPDKSNSSSSVDLDRQKNLYRHPSRQGAPTEYFTKEHDLYAVGVVMLEIGIWETVSTIYTSACRDARQGNPFSDAEKVQSHLMSLAETRLPILMGTKYAQAVRKCIGGFGIQQDDKEQTRLGLAFQQEVLDLLEAGLVL